MNRHTGSVPRVVTGGGPAFVALQRGPRWLPAISFALALCSAGHAAANVTQSGDVSPPFAPAPVVDLTGQTDLHRQHVGRRRRDRHGHRHRGRHPHGGPDRAGHRRASAPASSPSRAPAASSNLTGGAASNGLDIGSWGTGIVTVSNGGTIACASVAACPFNTIGNGAGSTGTLSINAGSVSGLGSTHGRAGGPAGPASARQAPTPPATLSISERRNPVVERQLASSPPTVGQTGHRDRQRHDQRRRLEHGRSPATSPAAASRRA